MTDSTRTLPRNHAAYLERFDLESAGRPALRGHDLQRLDRLAFFRVLEDEYQDEDYGPRVGDVLTVDLDMTDQKAMEKDWDEAPGDVWMVFAGVDGGRPTLAQIFDPGDEPFDLGEAPLLGTVVGLSRSFPLRRTALDDLLARVDARWRAYRRERPVVELGSWDARYVEEYTRIEVELIPERKEELLAVAADPRVWDAKLGLGAETVHEVIRQAIELLFSQRYQVVDRAVSATTHAHEQSCAIDEAAGSNAE